MFLASWHQFWGKFRVGSSMQSWDEGRTCSWNLPSSGFLGSDHLRPLDALHSTGNYGLQALNTTGVRFGRLEIQKSAKVLHFSNHFGFMYSLNEEIIQFFPRLLPVGWKIKERHADLSNPDVLKTHDVQQDPGSTHGIAVGARQHHGFWWRSKQGGVAAMLWLGNLKIRWPFVTLPKAL